MPRKPGAETGKREQSKRAGGGHSASVLRSAAGTPPWLGRARAGLEGSPGLERSSGDEGWVGVGGLGGPWAPFSPRVPLLPLFVLGS